MKISQLVAIKKTMPYHESVASRLPRGIKTQQQLLNLGYQITVEDLGLLKAKTLNENFAAKLVNSYHNQSLNEGVGSFLGKAAGNVVGAVGAAGRGLKGAWNDAKAGYAAAKGSWNPTDGAAPADGGTNRPFVAPAGGGSSAPAAANSFDHDAADAAYAARYGNGPGQRPVFSSPSVNAAGGGAEDATDAAYAARYGNGPGQQPVFSSPSVNAAAAPTAAPSPGGATPTPPTAGTPPKTGGSVGDIMKAIDGLDPASKKQLAGELDKSINTPPPAAEKPAGATPPAAPGATPPAKSPVTGSSGGGQNMMNLKGAGVQDASQLANLQKTGAANLAAQKGAANMNIQKPTFAADKRTPAQQAKMKQAGFREDVEFHSNFLGIDI